jgi:hypothetical protein
MAFCCAGISDWKSVKQYIDDIQASATTFEIPLTGTLGILATYLTGVYYQGSGNLDLALQIFRDARFDLSAFKSPNSSSAHHVERDISLLAALNSIWILQEKSRQDVVMNENLVSKLEPFCANNPNKDIQTAFNLIVATVNMNPPTPLIKIKSYLRAALSGATSTGNTQFLCMTLSVMCSKFFNNIVGDQAEKSAKAAVVQAEKSGNVLWKSVADGMLAQCFEVQGKKKEAQATLELAQQLAQRALPDS